MHSFGYHARATSRHLQTDFDWHGTLSYTSDQAPGYRTIVRLPTYERTARGLLSDLEERWLDDLLGRVPRSGAVIPGTGGVRKIRLALPGRGKRGGARVIDYYRGSKHRGYWSLSP